MSENKPSFDPEVVLNWPFQEEHRSYTKADCVRYAKGFGAGLPGELCEGDQAFLNAEDPKVLPVMVVPLADGEFWQARPESTITWQKMVHAGESITVHKPLSSEGEVTLVQSVDKLLDRGADRGAVMLQALEFSTATEKLATIDVTMMLLADGGFGGEPDNRPRDKWVPDDRSADAQVDILTPLNGMPNNRPLLELKVDLDVKGGGNPNQLPLRGVCSFGIAGRGALYLLCNNQPERLKHLSVRYAGMMFTDETMRVEVWHLSPGRAALRMSCVEREQLVLNHCLVEFEPE